MKNLLIYIIGICFLTSCSDVIEKPITNATLLIYTPADLFVTKNYSQQFYWEPVSGATSYRLQIAKPSFSAGKIQSIVLDTILTINKITFTLNPGEYEWRLRAQNSGSETPFYTRKLFIVETTFDERTFTVSKPASDKPYITYASGVPFEWTNLSGTENYYIEIDTLSGGFKNPTRITIDGDLTKISALLTKRGSYNWRMYADSAGIKSKYTNSGQIDFKMDTVSVSTPANNTSNLNQSVDLVWKKPSNGLSTDIYSYTVSVYNSTNVLEFTIPDLKTETTKLTGLTKGSTYYWSIAVKDQYKTESAPTAKSKFTVAP